MSMQGRVLLGSTSGFCSQARTADRATLLHVPQSRTTRTHSSIWFGTSGVCKRGLCAAWLAQHPVEGVEKLGRAEFRVKIALRLLDDACTWTLAVKGPQGPSQVHL